MELQRAMLQNPRAKDEVLPAEFMTLVDNLRDHFAKQRELRNALKVALYEPSSIRVQLRTLNTDLDELAEIVSQTELRVATQLQTAEVFKLGELQSCSRNIDFVKRLAEVQISNFAASGGLNTSQANSRFGLASLSESNPLKRELDDALVGVYSDALADCERRLIAASQQLSKLEEQLLAELDGAQAQHATTEQFASNLVYAFGAFTACAARVEQFHSALREVRERLVAQVHAAYGDSIAQQLAAATSLTDGVSGLPANVRLTSQKLPNAFASHFLSSDSVASRSVLADLARREGEAHASAATPTQQTQTPGRHASTVTQKRADAENVPHMRIQLDTPTQRESNRTPASGTNLVGPSPFTAASGLRSLAQDSASRLGTPSQLITLPPSGIGLAGTNASTPAVGANPAPAATFTPLGSFGQSNQPRPAATVLSFGTASSTSTPAGGFAAAAPNLTANLSTAAATGAASPFTLGAASPRPAEQPQFGTKRAR